MSIVIVGHGSIGSKFNAELKQRGIPSKSIFAYHDIHGRYDIDIVSIFHFTV